MELIESNIRKYLDEGRWEGERARQEKERKVLTKTSERWDEVTDFLATSVITSNPAMCDHFKTGHMTALRI